MSDYYDEFTDSNRDVLERLNLINKDLVNIEPESPLDTTVEWSQRNMQFFGDVARNYRVARFRTPDNNLVPVFVAEECGMPPPAFNTSGFHTQNNGRLYFGIMDLSDSATLFFVIHPATWYPFQKRFAETDVIEALQESSMHGTGAWIGGKVAGAAATAGMTAAVGGTVAGAGAAAAAVGAGAAAAAPIVIPFLAVAAAGAGATFLAGELFDAQVGDYLRYIGPGGVARL